MKKWKEGKLGNNLVSKWEKAQNAENTKTKLSVGKLERQGETKWQEERGKNGYDTT